MDKTGVPAKVVGTPVANARVVKRGYTVDSKFISLMICPVQPARPPPIPAIPLIPARPPLFAKLPIILPDGAAPIDS